jgi:hypothetical protein
LPTDVQKFPTVVLKLPILVVKGPTIEQFASCCHKVAYSYSEVS